MSLDVFLILERALTANKSDLAVSLLIKLLSDAVLMVLALAINF
jgi:hypothetical protein